MARNARRPAESPRRPRPAKASDDSSTASSAPSGRSGKRDEKAPFLSDVRALRERARQHIEEGPVTAGYGANLPTVLRLLNDALATELVCVLRYKQHYFAATGTRGETVAAEFLQHANEEQQHADLIAARIVQLGGSPDFNPSGLLSRSHSEYAEGETLTEMVREDLVAERVAIDSYREMIDYIGDGDVTTRRMLEGILAVEEEHADDLRDLLADMKG
jgi:bacterioferritin